MNKRVLVAAGILLFFVAFVTAQQIFHLVVVHTDSCSETDGGFNYTTTGSITGNFWWNKGNTTYRYNGTFTDTCIQGNVLVEGVCGSSLHHNLTNRAALAYVDCSQLNKSCSQGRCV